MAAPQPTGAFRWTQEPWGRALRCEALTPIAGHFYTTRDLGLRAASPDEAADWHKVARSIGVEPWALVRVRQVHGTAIFIMRRGDPVPPDDRRPQADILVTDDPSVALVVQVADCVPLLLADRRTGAVAAAHAGWRGTAAGVAGVAAGALVHAFGARPNDLVAAIGPGIGPCCYAVGEELRHVFARAGHPPDAIARWFTSQNGRSRLDLWQANRDQLVAAGVDPRRVHLAGLCTATHVEWFYSYRAEGAATGRIVGIIRARGG